MSKIDDGGPAFPPTHDPNHHVFGMTLRDYFAGQAMPQIFHAVGFKKIAKVGGIDGTSLIATAAYELADAMIKARQS